MSSNWKKLKPVIANCDKIKTNSEKRLFRAKTSKEAQPKLSSRKELVGAAKEPKAPKPAQVASNEITATKRKRSNSNDFLDLILGSKKRSTKIAADRSLNIPADIECSAIDETVAIAASSAPGPAVALPVQSEPSDLAQERIHALSILDSVLKSEESESLTQAEKKEKKKQLLEHIETKIPESQATKTGKYIAIDCEMVGVGDHGTDSALARVSIVNFHGHCLLDTFVTPRERVTDYRTHVSGITPKLLDPTQTPNVVSFDEAQKRVADLIKDRIVVGHALKNDFKALLLDHPRRLLRDTSEFRKFKAMAKGRKPALRKLAKQVLNVDIQGGEHSSVEDAQVSMLLYKKFKTEWEGAIMKRE